MNINKSILDLMEKAKEKSTCMKSPTNLVIETVRGEYILGYNGAPDGTKECNPCPRYDSPSGEDIDLCRGVHAERRAIYDAARQGISLEDSTMYLWRFPCAPCAKAIIQSGIKKLVAPTSFWDYPDTKIYQFEMAEQLLKESKIEVILSEEISK